jgi:putative membrane protein
MSSIRMIAAALAAALMVPATAQSAGEGAEKWRKGRAAATQPAPAQQSAGQPAQGQTALTEQQRAALGAVFVRNKLAIQAAEMAASRGASEEVKNLGRRLVDEHRRAETELTQLVAQRGGDVNALAPTPDRQRIEGEIGQLGTKSGEEFDRAFVAFVTQNHPGFVQDLKHARDVTPGKDAAFKKWLDGYENLEEEHLSVARQLKSQRQARTPPAR